MHRIVIFALAASLTVAPGFARAATGDDAGASAPTAASLIDKARLLLRSNDFQGALKVAQQAVTLAPNSPEAIALLGDVEDDLGDHVDAIIDYNKAIGLNPNYEYAYETKCNTELNLDKNAAAVADCDKAIALDPQDEDAFHDRSLAKYYLNDDAGALVDIGQALTIDQTYAGAYEAKCDILRDMGKFDDALDACNKAIGLDPSMSYVLYIRGRTYLGQGQYASAYADLSKYEAVAPDDEFGKIALARAEYGRGQAGDYAAALVNVNAYIARHDSIDSAYLLRAQIDVKLDKSDDAKSDATSALRYAAIDNDDEIAKAAQSLLDSLGVKP